MSKNYKITSKIIPEVLKDSSGLQTAINMQNNINKMINTPKPNIGIFSFNVLEEKQSIQEIKETSPLLSGISGITTSAIGAATLTSSPLSNLPGITSILQETSERLHVFSKMPVYGMHSMLSSIIDTLTPLNITNSIVSSMTQISNEWSAVCASHIISPAIKWLQSFDFYRIFEKISDFSVWEEKYKKTKEVYLHALYTANWFPYAGWTVDMEIMDDVAAILKTTRNGSKNREKKIDKIIFLYYNKKVITDIKRDWKNSYLDNHIKRILSQAINAYFRKEYALTISVLATMWEGILKIKIDNYNTKHQKKNFTRIVEKNDFNEIFSEFYNKLIIGTCYCEEDMIEGVPNRNGIAHSWYPKYPNRKSALNAILITDFILKLNPIATEDEFLNAEKY